MRHFKHSILKIFWRTPFLEVLDDTIYLLCFCRILWNKAKAKVEAKANAKVKAKVKVEVKGKFKIRELKFKRSKDKLS